MGDGSERDILIEVRTKVNDIHFNMTQPGGKVPRLESIVEKHASQISYWKGAVAVIAILILAFGAVLAEHLLSGKP